MHIEDGKKKKGSEGEATAVKPPDGGWGWMVVFGSFMIHLIADGMAYSFGVYVEWFLDEFEATRSEVGFLGSLMLGITWGSGPIAGALTKKYGCRLVAILGTIIAAFGFIISIFAPNIYFMYISFGIVAGVGLGFAYLPAIVAVSYYFEKRRSLATGLAVCGSGVGTIIFAPLTNLLLEEYGWKGTVLIETALLLNCIPFGAVFRELEPPRGKRVPLANQSEDGEGVELVRMYISDKEQHMERISNSSLNAKSTDQAAPAPGPMDRKDIFYTGSLQNFPEYKSDPDLYRKSITSIPKEDGHNSDDDDDPGCCFARLKRLLGGVCRKVAKSMDCSLMSDLCFLLFAISNMLTSVGFSVPYIFLPNRATVNGMTRDQGAWLISIIGFTNTIGRVVFGFLADFKWVNRLVLYNTALVIAGALSLLSALCTNFASMAAYAAGFGLFIGVYICLTPVVLVDLMGLERLSMAFGIVLLFQGVGTVAGPPIIGAVYDITQNYDNSFYLMGACILISGAMLYVIPWIRRLTGTKPNNTHTTKTGTTS